MPKIILPFQGAAAAGKNGKSENSLIYARTSADCEAQKMVTYTKAYKAPIQPNSALQLAARDKMRQLVLSLKQMQPYYVPGSLYGTYPTIESTFVSDRSRFIANAMKQGLLFYHQESWIKASESLFKVKLLFDDLFNAFFSLTNIFYAVQIRGDQIDSAFYRMTWKVDIADFTYPEEIYSRDTHAQTVFETMAVDETDFDGGKPYTARLWASLVSFPKPPVNSQIDATSTWDIGSSVRMDYLFNII